MICASMAIVLATRISASGVGETHAGLRLKRQDVAVRWSTVRTPQAALIPTRSHFPLALPLFFAIWICRGANRETTFTFRS